MDTIVAQATSRGVAGIGVIRVSGSDTRQVMLSILGRKLLPRYATLLPFYNKQHVTIDQGIAIFYPAPHSFTGEDVLELQAHGGSILLDNLLQAVRQVASSIRLAHPGEFSERAFLNGKLDLAQAEAISDLIHASSEQAAMFAVQSLQGRFSERIHQLVALLSELRVHVEAMLDFAEDIIDPLALDKIEKKLLDLEQQCKKVIQQASQGALLREGMKIVLLGAPNVGKSSLLNNLAGKDCAIVTEHPGTTRDIVQETIQIDGMPVYILDTAGVHITQDKIECLGIVRTRLALKQADRILLMVDANVVYNCMILPLLNDEPIDTKLFWPESLDLPLEDYKDKLTLIINKIDLIDNHETCLALNQAEHIHSNRLFVSAKDGLGIDVLRVHLKHCMGFDTSSLEGTFMARRRHLDALERAQSCIITARESWRASEALELLASTLQEAQLALGEITGVVRSDDLLGKIFSEFCIGK